MKKNNTDKLEGKTTKQEGEKCARTHTHTRNSALHGQKKKKKAAHEHTHAYVHIFQSFPYLLRGADRINVTICSLTSGFEDLHAHNSHIPAIAHQPLNTTQILKKKLPVNLGNETRQAYLLCVVAWQERKGTKCSKRWTNQTSRMEHSHENLVSHGMPELSVAPCLVNQRPKIHNSVHITQSWNRA